MLLLAGMDNQLNQVDCLHRKRLLALVNHFVAQTVHFLSKFGSDCEGRLLQAEAKIQKIDTDLRLLEAKLSHVATSTASRAEANTEKSQVGPKKSWLLLLERVNYQNLCVHVHSVLFISTYFISNPASKSRKI